MTKLILLLVLPILSYAQIPAYYSSVDFNLTGDDLKIPIHYLDRSHGWSTTKFKEKITTQFHEQRRLKKYL